MGSIDWTSLNVVDITLLVIIFISIVMGLGRGIISEVLSLVVLVAAFVIATYFSNDLAAYFSHTSAMKNVVQHGSAMTAVVGSANALNTAQSSSYVAIGVSFGILFLGTLIVGSLIRMLINSALGMGGLGFLNRLLGGIFGLVRGYLIDLVIIFLIQLSPLTSQPWWKQSQIVPLFQTQVEWLGARVSPVLANIKSTFESTVSHKDSGSV